VSIAPGYGNTAELQAQVRDLERQLAEAREFIEELKVLLDAAKHERDAAESQLAAQRERDGRDAVAAVAAEIREFVDQDADPFMDTIESWADRLEAALKERP